MSISTWDWHIDQEYIYIKKDKTSKYFIHSFPYKYLHFNLLYSPPSFSQHLPSNLAQLSIYSLLLPENPPPTPFSFISVIIRLYFLPLYSFPSHSQFFNVILWSSLQRPSIVFYCITWMEKATLLISKSNMTQYLLPQNMTILTFQLYHWID